METIRQYFPDLSGEMFSRLEMLDELYSYWNARINLISRKDIDSLMERHVLHSMSISRVITFQKGCRIMDAGTGGGFPGIPLAIIFPETEFTLVDSIGKKIKVVREIADSLGLKNVRPVQSRMEDVNGSYDFVVSRAVTNLPDFISWVKGKIDPVSRNSIKNGILYLKGGDLEEELQNIRYPVDIYDISSFFLEDFFETKKIVYVRIQN